MFFQLSLPSTTPAADTVGDSVLPELGTAGTLTIEAPQDDLHEQVARLFAARLRQPKDAQRVCIVADTAAALTFTAPPMAEAADEGLAPLQ
jgi:hypothetical protein